MLEIKDIKISTNLQFVAKVITEKYHLM